MTFTLPHPVDLRRPSPPPSRGRAGSPWAACSALIALGLAWELWLAPTGSGWLALKVLPLLLPLAGLLRNRMYTYRWVSLFVWLYFIEGVVRAASDRGIGGAARPGRGRAVPDAVRRLRAARALAAARMRRLLPRVEHRARCCRHCAAAVGPAQVLQRRRPLGLGGRLAQALPRPRAGGGPARQRPTRWPPCCAPARRTAPASYRRAATPGSSARRFPTRAAPRCC